MMVSRNFLYWRLSCYIWISWCLVGTHLDHTWITPGFQYPESGSAEHRGGGCSWNLLELCLLKCSWTGISPAASFTLIWDRAAPKAGTQSWCPWVHVQGWAWQEVQKKLLCVRKSMKSWDNRRKCFKIEFLYEGCICSCLFWNLHVPGVGLTSVVLQGFCRRRLEGIKVSGPKCSCGLSCTLDLTDPKSSCDLLFFSSPSSFLCSFIESSHLTPEMLMEGPWFGVVSASKILASLDLSPKI